jgi:hypothetical protein
MMGASLGLVNKQARGQRHQFDNLEGLIASDTVDTEVNTDSYRYRRLRIAG